MTCLKTIPGSWSQRTGPTPGEITLSTKKLCHTYSGMLIALVEEVDQHNIFDVESNLQNDQKSSHNHRQRVTDHRGTPIAIGTPPD